MRLGEAAFGFLAGARFFFRTARFFFGAARLFFRALFGRAHAGVDRVEGELTGGPAA